MFGNVANRFSYFRFYASLLLSTALQVRQSRGDRLGSARGTCMLCALRCCTLLLKTTRVSAF